MSMAMECLGFFQQGIQMDRSKNFNLNILS